MIEDTGVTCVGEKGPREKSDALHTSQFRDLKVRSKRLSPLVAQEYLYYLVPSRGGNPSMREGLIQFAARFIVVLVGAIRFP